MKGKCCYMSMGYETVNYSCGCSDKGKKIDGHFVGQIERKWCDGSIYKGEVNEHYSQRYPHEINGANGFGKFIFPNGDWHEGTYKDNVANGKGIFFHSNKNIYWEGEFLNDIYLMVETPDSISINLSLIKDNEGKKGDESYDIYRDSPLRYMGYANECGEAFAAWLPPFGVPATYGVAAVYVLADTFDKAIKDYWPRIVQHCLYRVV